MPAPDASVPEARPSPASIVDERFLLLLDTLPYPAFVIARGSQAIHYNTRFVDYLGSRPGPGPADRTAFTHPQDRAALEAARAESVPHDAEYVVECRIRRQDGVYRWHRVHNKPLFQDGQRIAYLGTAVDIDDARRANEVLEDRVRERTAALEAANIRLAAEEARYRALYNRTPMALHSSDDQARLVEVNDTWLEMFAAEPAAVLGRSVSDFMTPASAEAFRARAWPQMLESRGAVRVVDYQFVSASGRVFDGRLAARGVFDAQGRLVRTWAAIADITAEKQAEGALRQTQRLEATGQLTAGIAHDFNNLLTAILGNLELAARPGTEARHGRLIEGARTAAQRGAALTRQLLAFSRQQRIVAEAVDVDRALAGMLPLLGSAVGGAFALDVQYGQDLPLASADPTQLELAVLNLVLNARDAIATHGTATGRIRVETGTATIVDQARPSEPPPGDYVTVTVADEGPGMDAAVLDRIFEPFPAGATRPLDVLVVDDDPDVRTAAARLLLEAGHTVAETGSAAAALEACAARQGTFDLVLADVAMPGMSGVELATRLAAAWPALPVLLMTGYADERLLPPDGGFAVLPKPFRGDELAAAIAASLRPHPPRPKA